MYLAFNALIASNNVFIEPRSKQVSFIDFDSVFHPSLKIPSATTCGTTGYTCHLSWQNGKPNPKNSWCICADRYALALLNSEFLLVDSGSKATGEGGLFNQEELKRQSGKGIDQILFNLNAKYSIAAQLLESAIKCSSFQDCPFFSGIFGKIIQVFIIRRVIMTDKPIKSFRCGNIQVSIWKNEIEKDGHTIIRYSARPQKQFKNDEGKYQNTDYYFPEDLPRLNLVISKAFEFISLTESKDMGNMPV